MKSGTVAACGPGLDAALTHYRITTATRPLEDDDVPVWIAFDVSVPGLEVNFDSLGVHLEALPRAAWEFAGEDERAELRSLIAERSGRLVQELADNGLREWSGRWDMAARALVEIWVACETEVIGRRARGRGDRRPRPRGPAAGENQVRPFTRGLRFVASRRAPVASSASIRRLVRGGVGPAVATFGLRRLPGFRRVHRGGGATFLEFVADGTTRPRRARSRRRRRAFRYGS